MILETRENTVENEGSVSAFRGRMRKAEQGSGLCENRSGNSKRSRFTSNSKLVKSSLFRSIDQKARPYLQAQLEQRNVEIQLLQSASQNLSRELLGREHQIGHSFLRLVMAGQLALSRLALR